MDVTANRAPKLEADDCIERFLKKYSLNKCYHNDLLNTSGLKHWKLC